MASTTPTPEAKRLYGLFRTELELVESATVGSALKKSADDMQKTFECTHDVTPDPANRSSTRAPSIASSENSELKIASRTRSDVGRVSSPSGVTSFRPPSSPATTRIP